MRKLTVFEKENLARRFSIFLQKQKIENTLDVSMGPEDKFSYEIWIHDEDKIQQAENFINEFNKDPKNAKFDVSMQELYPDKEEQKEDIQDEKEDINKEEMQSKKNLYKITSIILGICIFIYAFNFFQELKIRKENPSIKYVLLTPVQSWFLFDVPHVLIQVDEIIRKYGIDPTKDIQKQSPQAFLELQKIDHSPYWRGFYDFFFTKKKLSV